MDNTQNSSSSITLHSNDSNAVVKDSHNETQSDGKSVDSKVDSIDKTEDCNLDHKSDDKKSSGYNQNTNDDENSPNTQDDISSLDLNILSKTIDDEIEEFIVKVKLSDKADDDIKTMIDYYEILLAEDYLGRLNLSKLEPVVIEYLKKEGKISEADIILSDCEQNLSDDVEKSFQEALEKFSKKFSYEDRVAKEMSAMEKERDELFALKNHLMNELKNNFKKNSESKNQKSKVPENGEVSKLFKKLDELSKRRIKFYNLHYTLYELEAKYKEADKLDDYEDAFNRDVTETYNNELLIIKVEKIRKIHKSKLEKLSKNKSELKKAQEKFDVLKKEHDEKKEEYQKLKKEKIEMMKMKQIQRENQEKSKHHGKFINQPELMRHYDALKAKLSKINDEISEIETFNKNK